MVSVSRAVISVTAASFPAASTTVGAFSSTTTWDLASHLGWTRGSSMSMMFTRTPSSFNNAMRIARRRLPSSPVFMMQRKTDIRQLSATNISGSCVVDLSRTSVLLFTTTTEDYDEGGVEFAAVCADYPNPMNNLYMEWTLEQDRLLYENRYESAPKLASMLGRGLRGVRERLNKLKDVKSPAYERLFADGDEGAVGMKKGERRMTPVSEVLRRIRWDGTLNPDEFVVIYYDRVEDKLMSTPFSAPNESVSGNEQSFVFAIPEHRITAVKYRERIVWDRDRRLDLVFGSVNGNGVTIDVVLGEYDEWKRRKEEEEARERQRLVQVASLTRSFLGEERFASLKRMSDDMRNERADEWNIAEFVTTAAKMFEDSYNEHKAECFGTIDTKLEMIASRDKGMDATASDPLELLSELMSTLPDEDLREAILSEINKHCDHGYKSRKDGHTVLPELYEDDLRERFVRGSGPGGQKINKTSSRVILVHEPTGIRVECQDTRSLQQNRKIARKRLRLRLDEFINGERSIVAVKAAKASNKKARARARNRARRRRKKEMESGAES